MVHQQFRQYGAVLSSLELSDPMELANDVKPEISVTTVTMLPKDSLRLGLSLLRIPICIDGPYSPPVAILERLKGPG